MRPAMMSLQEISDQLEIQRLTTRYAHAIDSKQFDLLDEVFTPDAEIDYRPAGGIGGRFPEIKQWLKNALAKYPAFQHLTANYDIVVDGDCATGRIMCFNPVLLAEPEGERIRFHGLWYVDTYKRTPKGWRISSRTEDQAFTHFWPRKAK
jgi:hypothetical protein